MPRAMKISVIIPIWKESKHLAQALQELDSFFQRIPSGLDFIFVVDPDRENTLDLLKSELSKYPQLKTTVIANTRRHGRAQSVLLGLRAAEGDICATASLDFSVPLGDLLTLIFEVIQNPNFDLLLAQRNSPKKQHSGTPNKWPLVYQNICEEKFHRSLKPNQENAQSRKILDPTTSTIVLRRERFQNFLAEVRTGAWYFTPALLKIAIDQKIPFLEKAVNTHHRANTRWSFTILLKEMFT